MLHAAAIPAVAVAAAVAVVAAVEKAVSYEILRQ